jgi:hypothetical protein
MPTDRRPGASCPLSPGEVRVRTLVVARRTPGYPAAHSMDKTWYAVDAHGHVGIFHSGENGHVPSGADQDEHLFWFIRFLSSGGTDTDPYADDDDEDEDYDSAEDQLGDRGIFVYWYVDPIEPFLAAYSGKVVPERAAHVDQLPPAVRKFVSKTVLAGANFATDDEVQPIGQVECFYYSDFEVAFLTAGEKEVRPIPGRDAEYKKALPQLRKEYPKLRFADPDGHGTRKPAAKKGKKR